MTGIEKFIPLTSIRSEKNYWLKEGRKHPLTVICLGANWGDPLRGTNEVSLALALEVTMDQLTGRDIMLLVATIPCLLHDPSMKSGLNLFI